MKEERVSGTPALFLGITKGMLLRTQALPAGKNFKNMISKNML